MKIFQTDTAAKLTAEVDRLEKRKAALAGKLVAAQSAEAAAKEAQRRFFVETENLDASDSARLSAAVASAVSEVAAVTDAIATVDQLIHEGQQAVTAAREAGERQKRAAEIQERIKKLEPLAAQAEKAFEQLASILERIIATADCSDLQLQEYRVIQGAISNLPAVNLAGAALTEALFRALPDAFAVSKIPTATYAAASLPLLIRRDGGLSPDLPLDDETGAGFRPLPLSGALTANLIDPLKQAASEILDGTRALASARTVIDEDDEDGDPVYEHRIAVLTRPIRWRDAAGNVHEHSDTSADLPAPVIAAAVAAGVAFPHGSPEATRQIQLRENAGLRHEAHILNKTGWVDLKVKWSAPERIAA